MARIVYEKTNFGPAALRTIQQANAICAQYAAQGLDLTLRQLYYQFVSRDLIPNKQSEYKKLGDVINKARLSGLLDWDYIVDRTRNLRELAHWEDPAEIVEVVSRQFRTDRWATQPTRVEVWVEKDALIGVLEGVCNREDVPFFSCRGYTSQTEVWGAAQRLGQYVEAGQNVAIIHLGDHDPSGIDMTRDITTRIRNFMTQDYLNAHGSDFPEGSVKVRDILTAMADHCDGRGPIEIRRIALNWDQVEEYQPPPNPTKMSDSRSAGYLAEYGDESWELDALEPNVLIGLITEAIESFRDEEAWGEASVEMARHKAQLSDISDNWREVVEWLESHGEAS